MSQLPESPTPAATTRTAPLALHPDAFRAIGHDLVERIADFLASIPDRPVTRAESPADLRTLIGAGIPLPEQGDDPAALVAGAAALLFDHSLLNGHPRFFGYVTSSPAPVGMLADLLAAAVNPNVGGWTLSPMATEIEVQTVRWIAELIGYPADAGGLLVSGGNMANFVGFLAARAAVGEGALRRAGVGRDGGGRLRVYGSAETHTWIEKANDLFGLGTEAFRWIPTDDAQRIDMAALRTAIEQDLAAGERPMAVIGSAGTVSTGAVDPLFEIAALCREHGIWFHVDGAYGGFAAAAPGVPRDLQAIALADSVAVDPHKWLYAPLEAGCALVRDRNLLRDAFTYRPAYYHFEGESTNFVDFGPQNSRGFRALKVWLALRQAGRAGYAASIAEDIRLARRLYDRAAAHPEIEALTHGLSIAAFRYVPLELRPHLGEHRTETYLNELNQQLLDHVQKSGELFVSNAVIGGRYALRACIVNFRTTEADVDAVPDIVARLGRRLHAGPAAPAEAPLA